MRGTEPRNAGSRVMFPSPDRRGPGSAPQTVSSGVQGLFLLQPGRWRSKCILQLLQLAGGFGGPVTSKTQGGRQGEVQISRNGPAASSHPADSRRLLTGVTGSAPPYHPHPNTLEGGQENNRIWTGRWWSVEVQSTGLSCIQSGFDHQHHMIPTHPWVWLQRPLNTSWVTWVSPAL